MTFHENGKVKIDAFIKNNVLDSIYKEYYDNGNLKTEGFYKDCEYKTNKREIYILNCSVGVRLNDSIRKNKLHGTWKSYLEDGVLDSSTSFYCDMLQGTSIYYKNKNVWFTEFYSDNELIYSQEYNEEGFVITSSNYEYEYGRKSQPFRKIQTFEFYDNGKLKSITRESNKDDTEEYKEYYENGFLKLEQQSEKWRRNGVYREYYENGNSKYEGIFKDDIPVKKQYYYNEDGSILKIETWKKGKISKTEYPKN